MVKFIYPKPNPKSNKKLFEVGKWRKSGKHFPFFCINPTSNDFTVLTTPGGRQRKQQLTDAPEEVEELFEFDHYVFNIIAWEEFTNKPGEAIYFTINFEEHLKSEDFMDLNPAFYCLNCVNLEYDGFPVYCAEVDRFFEIFEGFYRDYLEFGVGFGIKMNVFVTDYWKFRLNDFTVDKVLPPDDENIFLLK